jgi:hypothetical protein
VKPVWKEESPQQTQVVGLNFVHQCSTHLLQITSGLWDEPTISPSIIKYTILSLLGLCDMHTEISSQDNAAEPPTTSSAPSMNPYDNGDDQFDFILNSMCFWMIQSISGQ